MIDKFDKLRKNKHKSYVYQHQLFYKFNYTNLKTLLLYMSYAI